jgi:hypothetical protein
MTGLAALALTAAVACHDAPLPSHSPDRVPRIQSRDLTVATASATVTDLGGIGGYPNRVRVGDQREWPRTCR